MNGLYTVVLLIFPEIVGKTVTVIIIQNTYTEISLKVLKNNNQSMPDIRNFKHSIRKF